jgi:hypothetical protein
LLPRLKLISIQIPIYFDDEMISLLDHGVQRPREAMMLRAPETEALYEGNAQKGFGVSILDGSTVSLGSTAAYEPIEILRSLWGRWKSLDATGSKPCGSRSTATPNKRISVIINNHRGTSGLSGKGMLAGLGGRVGRELEIIYDAGRWQAHIPVEVGEEPPKSNKRGYVKPNYKGKIVNPRSIKQRDPIGDKQAFMDMDLNNLFAVVITDGSAMLVKGGSIKSEYYWWKREI